MDENVLKAKLIEARDVMKHKGRIAEEEMHVSSDSWRFG
jgi:hypothetical protein